MMRSKIIYTTMIVSIGFMLQSNLSNAEEKVQCPPDISDSEIFKACKEYAPNIKMLQEEWCAKGYKSYIKKCKEERHKTCSYVMKAVMDSKACDLASVDKGGYVVIPWLLSCAVGVNAAHKACKN